ncbi:MAG: HTH domain-containing protein [Candidatus Moranbacteria bacterium]|jgi:DNA-directed RNA polymerase delta subunit|nr:HTH domain-containing protein [Candidatus Moranbacteria bacterium]
MSKKNSKKNKENLFFEEVVNSITKDVNERAIAMIADRFGFGKKNTKTLGQIGETYGITRERVRQIIKEAVSKVKHKSKSDDLFKEAEEKLSFAIKEKHGIISKKDLIKMMKEDGRDENFISFILHCSDNFKIIEAEIDMEEVVTLHHFDLRFWKSVKEKAKDVLSKHNKALHANDFFDEFLKIHPELEKEMFFNFLKVSREIKQGVFEKWGIHNWKEISPKGVREKAHLVIREKNKPLHFREVAKLIDEYKLSKKKTHPQTVHNELIKDEKFVLVGRGTYALREWGYQRGTVKDVISEILTSSKKPLHQDEVIERVLSVRNVKKTTVIINLNKFFDKLDKQKYSLKEKKTKVVA